MDAALRARCAEALHVITADGEVLHSGQAILFMAHAIGWGPVASLGGLPPMRWGVELGYRWMARNRTWLSRYLFRSE